ncbi:MAG: hypothetical protein KZQ78_01610 [Candidatus Thiodiazotropha sp. (ex Ustalcina ferruginea)]|nr:hypothetical protein [Candidatus Thiodiazotropha sp. (ex Ustalcina ferruginea)]
MGEFNSQSYDQVVNVLEANPQISQIVLTANAGSLDDETTFRLARYIRNHKLNTHLLDQSLIASGAVDLFLSGMERTIERGARIGVHSWSDGIRQASDFPTDHADHKMNAEYVETMLGSDEFYWFTIRAASADSIYWMTEDEVRRYHLVTRAFLPPSGNRTPFDEEFFEQRVLILESVD